MLIINIFLQINVIQVETMLASTAVKARRIQSQSMRIPSYNPELSPRASSPVSRNFESDARPIASTSAFLPEIDIQQQQHQHQETHLQPLVEEKTKHVRVVSSSSLIDPMAVTYSEHLNPTRDGVFARMRNRMLRYGASVAIGVAIGAGGLTAEQFLSQNNTITKPVNTTENLSKQTNVEEEFSNPF